MTSVLCTSMCRHCGLHSTANRYTSLVLSNDLHLHIIHSKHWLLDKYNTKIFASFQIFNNTSKLTNIYIIHKFNECQYLVQLPSALHDVTAPWEISSQYHAMQNDSKKHDCIHKSAKCLHGADVQCTVFTECVKYLPVNDMINVTMHVKEEAKLHNTVNMNL